MVALVDGGAVVIGSFTGDGGMSRMCSARGYVWLACGAGRGVVVRTSDDSASTQLLITHLDFCGREIPYINIIYIIYYEIRYDIRI
jgi:hypothetical protein